MAFKTFTSTTFSSSDVNTYLMKQANIVCTSGTRPASPNEGMTIYETDTDRQLIYTTATTGWRQPWNMPWGYITYASSIATTSGITTDADVLTVTFTAVPQRRYKMTYSALALLNTSSASVFGKITDNTPTPIATDMHFGDPNTLVSVFVTAMFNPSVAGSVTFRGRISCNAGTLTLQGLAGSQIHQFLVEDIGPNGAPS